MEHLLRSVIVMDKKPIVTELIGEASTGKTHTSLLFSNPVLADLTLRGKSEINVQRLYPEDWKDRYFRIKSLKDLKDAVKKAQEDGRATFIIETGSDLRLLLGEEHLKELQKDKPNRQTLHPTEWKQVNRWFAEIIEGLAETHKINIILTAEMADEWGKDSKPTGRRRRLGFPRTEFYCDLRLYLKIETKVTGANPEVVEKKRVAIVAKNGLVDSTSPEWIGKIELPRDNTPSELKTFRLIMELTQLPEEMWVM